MVRKKGGGPPKTFLLQCEKCELILRFDENELEGQHELPTFCHLIPKSDLESRLDTCKGPFKKPKGI